MTIFDDPADEKFLHVPVGASVRNPCSPPARDAGFRGIVIRAPRRVDARFGTTIPICGYYALPAAELPSMDRPTDAFRLVAVHRDSAVERSGFIIPDDDGAAPTPTTEDPARLAGLVVGGYFNPSLTDHVALPVWQGRYDVFVEMGRWRSNVVSILVAKSARFTA
jgi:hypothetical protein